MTEIVADFDHMMEEAGSTAARYMTRESLINSR